MQTISTKKFYTPQEIVQKKLSPNRLNHLENPFSMTLCHRHMAWGVQGGRGQMQATCLVDRQSLKQPLGHFRDGPPLGHRRVGMAGRSDTLGSPWPPLAIRPCFGHKYSSILCIKILESPCQSCFKHYQ